MVPSFHVGFHFRFRPSVRKPTPIPAVLSLNVTNKSYLVCVKSEKYAFWVTLRPLGFMRRGEAELGKLKFTSEVFHLPRLGTKQLCALAHLGCTLAAGTSRYIYVYSFFLAYYIIFTHKQMHQSTHLVPTNVAQKQVQTT